jgi:hypothetical protein
MSERPTPFKHNAMKFNVQAFKPELEDKVYVKIASSSLKLAT